VTRAIGKLGIAPIECVRLPARPNSKKIAIPIEKILQHFVENAAIPRAFRFQSRADSGNTLRNASCKIQFLACLQRLAIGDIVLNFLILPVDDRSRILGEEIGSDSKYDSNGRSRNKRQFNRERMHVHDELPSTVREENKFHSSLKPMND
jgi:hypothetical protein